MVLAVVVPGNGAFAADGTWRITPRCRRLVAAAELLARDLSPAAVVFSGWSPSGTADSEAVQMASAWRGPSVELVLEPTARTTVENAARTLPLLRERGVDRAVVVVAATHLLRARLFFEPLYRRHGISPRFHVVRELPSVGTVARELAALPLVPWQLSSALARLPRG
jgi:hypothetical protein